MDGDEALLDVDVLKLLYLIRYIDDIPANLDNIVILMADDIRMDKITMRETICDCLNRLMSQNYIGRTGEVYNFDRRRTGYSERNQKHSCGYRLLL